MLTRRCKLVANFSLSVPSTNLPVLCIPNPPPPTYYLPQTQLPASDELAACP
ncbi:hypothetical protein IF2G_06352 [Cordyceps javanica]|nr:hypothetical protein IF2G_06352 [Cordyceps javanica]